MALVLTRAVPRGGLFPATLAAWMSVLPQSIASASSTTSTWSPSSIWSRLTGLLNNDDGLLFAVPKRKVSPSRKGIRLQFSHIRRLENLKKCPSCNEVHVQHQLCPYCFPFNPFLRAKHRSGSEGESDSKLERRRMNGFFDRNKPN